MARLERYYWFVYIWTNLAGALLKNRTVYRLRAIDVRGNYHCFEDIARTIHEANRDQEMAQRCHLLSHRDNLCIWVSFHRFWDTAVRISQQFQGIKPRKKVLGRHDSYPCIRISARNRNYVDWFGFDDTPRVNSKEIKNGHALKGVPWSHIASRLHVGNLFPTHRIR